MGSGNCFKVCSVIVYNNGEYDPPSNYAGIKWYNVLTFGTPERCTQVAFQAFTNDPNNENNIWVRNQHDSIDAVWMLLQTGSNIGDQYQANSIPTILNVGVDTRVTTEVTIPKGTYIVMGRTSFGHDIIFDLKLYCNGQLRYMQCNTNTIILPLTVATNTTLYMAVHNNSANSIDMTEDNNLTYLQVVKIK